MYSECSRFHPNQFAFGGVIPELENTIKTGRKVMRVAAWYSGTSGPKFTKIGDDLLHAQMPLIVTNLVALGQTIYEKSVTIFSHPSLVDPWAKVHQSW